LGSVPTVGRSHHPGSKGEDQVSRMSQTAARAKYKRVTGENPLDPQGETGAIEED